MGVVTRLGVANGNEIKQLGFSLIDTLVKICHINSGKKTIYLIISIYNYIHSVYCMNTVVKL